MKKNISNVLRYLPYALLAIIVLIIFYGVFYRAAHLSMTHDESLSYLQFVYNRGYLEILKNLNVGYDSNNHLLNSFFMKFWSDRFGLSEWSLRFASVLAWPIFAAALIYILKNCFKGWWLFWSFLVSVSSFLVLDFFSLARGYAPALALFTFSLACFVAYFFDDHLQSAKLNKSLIFFLSFSAAMSVWFHYSFAYLYVMIIALWCLFNLFRNEATFDKRFWLDYALLIPGFLAFCYVIPKMLYITKTKQIFGGTTGFWFDTVGTLVHSCSVSWSYFEVVAKIFVAISMLAVSVYIIKYKLYKFTVWPSLITSELIMLLFWLFIVGSLVIIKLQFWISQTFYPQDRAGLYFIPLFFVLTSLFIYNTSLRLTRYKAIFISFSLAIAIFFITSFVSAYKLNTTVLWFYDSHTKEVVHELQVLVAPIPLADGYYLNSAVNWIFEPTFNFYILNNSQSNHLNYVDRSGPDQAFLFYYLSLPNNQNIIDKYHLTTIKRFTDINTALAINQEAFEQFKSTNHK